MELTQDKFLDGRITLKQTKLGYRAGIDAVLLAAFVKAHEQGSILDIGSGVGAISLCLAAHHEDIEITGLEVQEELVQLAQENNEINGFQHRVKFVKGDLYYPPKALPFNSFSAVVTNPPYFDLGEGAKNKETSKAKARHTNNIQDWMTSCLKFVKPRGHIFLIHRADQIDKIITALSTQAGAIKINPLWAAPKRPAKLILVSARKGVKTGCEILPGELLHDSPNTYTDKIEAILRGKSLF